MAEHFKKNTLRILRADGTIRVSYFNVVNFKVINEHFFSFEVGPNTTWSRYPMEKPLEAGDDYENSESLIIGRVYTMHEPCEYKEDPIPTHHIHHKKFQLF